MTKKYYIHNMFWGYFMMLVMIYLNYNDHTIEGVLMLTLSIPSAIFFSFLQDAYRKIHIKIYNKKNSGILDYL